MMNKSSLRNKMRIWRNQLDAGMHAEWSELICFHLDQLIGGQEISTLHTFLPIGSEVNIEPVIQRCLNKGLRVVVTETLDPPNLRHLVLKQSDHMVVGKFGTKYPDPAEQYTGDFDLILIPGLAFDSLGYRIGYGVGYYDHFLGNLQTQSIKVGVAFAHQCIDGTLPIEDHDQRMDLIVNELGCHPIHHSYIG